MSASLLKYLTLDSTTFQGDFATALQTSAGVGDANKIVATAASGQLDPSLIPGSPPAFPPTVKTGNFAAGISTANLVDLATAAGNVTCTLPDATTSGYAGQMILVNVITNSASHHVAFATTSAQTINGAAASSLDHLNNLPQSYLFLCDGANWETVSLLVDLPTQVSGLLAQANGGTGIDSSAVTDGQLFIGATSGHSFSLATLTAGSTKIGITNGAHSITIDVNQGNLSLGSIGGSITLTTQVTGILPPANGGTGNSGVPTNGQIPIGNSGTSVYDPATLTAGSSKIGITNGAGSITLDVNQGNLTLSSIGGAILVTQDYDLWTGTASEAITAGALINIFNASGTMKVRNADNTSSAKRAMGWAPNSISSGVSGTVKLGGGPNPSAFTTLTLGVDEFLGTAGGTVESGSVPTASGSIIQRVGFATGTGAFEVQLDKEFIIP